MFIFLQICIEYLLTYISALVGRLVFNSGELRPLSLNCFRVISNYYHYYDFTQVYTKSTQAVPPCGKILQLTKHISVGSVATTANVSKIFTLILLVEHGK